MRLLLVCFYTAYNLSGVVYLNIKKVINMKVYQLIALNLPRPQIYTLAQ